MLLLSSAGDARFLVWRAGTFGRSPLDSPGTEVATIFYTAARYYLAKVGSSNGDVHPGNSALHTGAISPHPSFVWGLFYITPRVGNRAQVFTTMPAFSCIS
jgi:hypothetical protein